MSFMLRHLNKQLYERSLGLLLIRVGTGLVFFMHGTSKLGSMAMTTGFFMHLGLPGWTAPAIALLETIGGLALILGIFTRVFALLLGIEMLVAIFLTGFTQGGWSAHELEGLLMAVSFGIVYTGSGRFSLWHWDPKIDR
jgi:putative oxidoreductase